MRRLLTLKQGLTELEDLDFNLSDEDEDDNDSEDEFSNFSSDGDNELWHSVAENGLDDSELADLLNDARSSNAQKKTKKEKKKPERILADKRALLPTTEPVYELVEPIFVKSNKTTSSTYTQRGDLYGEATSLDSADIADKNVRKKALRFHVSKIESANVRRQNARNALGGDEDIPYRERGRRLEVKATRKGLGAGGDDLDDEEPEPRMNDKKRLREGDSDISSDADENEDGYYSLVKKQNAEKKAEKKAKYEAEAKATK